jgi:hypothetical protein
VGKLTQQFTEIPTIKGQQLYREGEAAEYVYLVKEGQFEVTRTLTFKEDAAERTKRIFSNPQRANKDKGSSQHSSIKKMKQIQVYVSSHQLTIAVVPIRKRKCHWR